jgi:hypothetical protein
MFLLQGFKIKWNNVDTEGESGALPTIELPVLLGPLTYEILCGKTENFQM